MINIRITAEKAKTVPSIIKENNSPLCLINEISESASKRCLIGQKELSAPGMSGGRGLLLISENEGLCQRDIVRSTGKKKSNVSLMLSKFERDGYIVRRTDETDRRETRIFLTEKGKCSARVLHEKYRETEKKLTEGFTSNEYETFVKLLSKARENLQK